MYSSRGGRSSNNPQQSSTSVTGIGCNRCSKNLTTTLFVCSCDCVFCEGKSFILHRVLCQCCSDLCTYRPSPFLSLSHPAQECTYEHFNSSSICPCCNKTLGVNDFLELVVADASSSQQDSSGSIKSAFQGMFTKLSSNSRIVSHKDMCSRVLKSLDDNRRTVRFLLKQFVRETNTKGQHSGDLGRENARLQQELTQLKQSMNSERINHQKTTADLQHRMQALQSTNESLQVDLKKKEEQVAQYRGIFAAEGQARMPSSSHSGSSGGGKRGQPSPGLPPMQGFVQQRQAHELAKQQALQQMTRGRSPFDNAGHHPTSSRPPSMVVPPSSSMRGGGVLSTTPIAIPRSSRSTGSAGSSGLNLPPTPRIRDFTSSSGYRFHGRSSSSGGGAYPHKRARTPNSRGHSPATAFAYNNSASSRADEPEQYIHPRRSSSYPNMNSSRGFGHR